MRIKKWNARLALLTIAVLLFHTAYQIVAYLVFYYNPMLSAVSGLTLAGLTVLHAILSAISVFVLKNTKTVKYKKLNIKTVFQRVFGALILVLLPIHIFSFGLLKSSAGSFGYYLAEASQILFYASIYFHAALSFSNALITLGRLESIKKKRVIDVVLWVVCTIMVVVTSVSITIVHSKIIH